MTLLSAVAIVIGTIVSGALLSLTPLTPPKFELSAGEALAGLMVGSVVVAAGVMLLAPYLRGSRAQRFALLFLLVYFAHAVNTVIETSIFTTIGGSAYLLTIHALPSLLCAVIAMNAACTGTAVRARFVDALLGNLPARILAAWLAFPAIYLFFGTIVSPFVIGFYRTPGGMFVIPAYGTLVLVQLARSALYLLPAYLLINAWAGTRRRLFWSFGLSMFFLVGLFGLLTPGMLPARLRLVHILEILADSIVYAGVLVILFAPRKTGAATAAIATAKSLNAAA